MRNLAGCSIANGLCRDPLQMSALCQSTAFLQNAHQKRCIPDKLLQENGDLDFGLQRSILQDKVNSVFKLHFASLVL